MMIFKLAKMAKLSKDDKVNEAGSADKRYHTNNRNLPLFSQSDVELLENTLDNGF